jgi:hypothetical protein
MHMNRKVQALPRVLAVLLFAGFSNIAAAHPGHGEPISREEAVQRGGAQIDRLVQAGKLDKSWKVSGTLESAQLQEKGEAREWALVFQNPQASEEQQRTLYVFLSETGEYLAANFTGR